MKIIAKVKLKVNNDEKQSLLDTMFAFNNACNYISEYAWDNQIFQKFGIQKDIYYIVRDSYSLSAQLTVRAIAKVCDSYKTQFEQKKKKKLTWTKAMFKKKGAVTYDERILSWNLENQVVSILTLDGRIKVPFLANDYNYNLLFNQKGQTDLIYKNGNFFLNTVCEVDEPPDNYFDDVIGVDLGVANIAVTSDKQFYTSDVLENARLKYQRRRSILQSVDTKSAKRRLRKLSGKQNRFQRDINHQISKDIVTLAKDTGRGIAVEDLTGIRESVTARHEQRAKHHNWSFYQLRDFITYKAKRLGVAVFNIDPAYTSQTCPCCGYISKRNRKTQSEFVCKDCGFSEHADYVGALNIRNRGRINLPMAASFG
jgi:putative transposase